MSIEKYHITYNHIHKTMKEMAVTVEKSGFNPDVIVAIGTGGFIPARILRTFLPLPILTVGIAYYDKENNPSEYPRKIQWIDEVEQKLAGKKILLVDEVDDSRITLEYCLRELLSHDPEGIAVAVLHNKDKEKKGSIPDAVAHYFAGEQMADRWIVYPWDAEDIDLHDTLA